MKEIFSFWKLKISFTEIFHESLKKTVWLEFNVKRHCEIDGKLVFHEIPIKFYKIIRNFKKLFWLMVSNVISTDKIVFKVGNKVTSVDSSVDSFWCFHYTVWTYCNIIELNSKIFIGVPFYKVLGFNYKQKRQLLYYEVTVLYISFKISKRKVIFHNSFGWLLLKIPQETKTSSKFITQKILGLLQLMLFGS